MGRGGESWGMMFFVGKEVEGEWQGKEQNDRSKWWKRNKRQMKREGGRLKGGEGNLLLTKSMPNAAQNGSDQNQWHVF